jgi:hypothetical protein
MREIADENMRRYPKYRPRKEFLHLELQLEAGFEQKAWRKSIDGILHGKTCTKSYHEQFKLRRRIYRAHLRRNRWNAKRQLKKREALVQAIRPEYLLYAIGGLVKVGDIEADTFRGDLLAGVHCLDKRLTRKFLDEMEVIHERINPSVPPWEIDMQRAKLEAEAEPVVFKERADFEATLAPTPVPMTSPDTIAFDPCCIAPAEDDAIESQTLAAVGTAP